jgi:MFS transporter, ACS family, tartrate transporter
MGYHLRLYGADHRAVVVLHPTLSAGSRRGGLFSRHRPYLTWWGPSYYRSRILGVFVAAIPLSGILGSLLSGFLLDLDGWMGVAEWQWLFILEGAPAVPPGMAFWYTMTDWSSQAHWLTTEQRNWLTARLDSERSRRQTIWHYSVTQALTNGRVLKSDSNR